MGQSCSQSCSYPRNGFADQGGLVQAGLRAGGCGAPKLAATPLRPAGIRPRREEEIPVSFHTAAFQVSVTAPSQASADGDASSASQPGARAGWTCAYTLGPMLGDGISAKVYEAEAVVQASDSSSSVFESSLWGSCGGVAVPQCFRERSRRVAIKRFNRAGSRTYQKELAALRRVGIHPHVLRLLESYEGYETGPDGVREDVLVLEYCDGSTLYDLYAREHPNGGLPERLIARLIRQLLLALEHLAARGVEHQDVKPENMMLHDVSVQSQQGELKLGDFGWAAIAPPPGTARVNKLPVTGAGSLWYAPPELNPPVKGITQETELPKDEKGNPVQGRSDMWSVGVVLYLLLVGHNPFNIALKQPSMEAVDNEVLRLAALGQFNRRTEKWTQLHEEARDFISVLLRVKPSARPAAAEALHHPFLTRRVAKSYDSSVFFHGAMPAWADRDLTWSSLDGFQRLAWVAIAHAVAEPELDKSVVTGALDACSGDATSQQGRQPGAPVGVTAEPAYLWQLAKELATTPVFQWLQDRGAWGDVVRLAFSYLDVDADGVLSAKDLFLHVAKPMPGDPQEPEVRREGMPANVGNSSWALASRWVARWQDPDAGPGAKGLPITSFRDALLDSHRSDDAILGSFDAPLSRRESQPLRPDLGQADFADAYARPGHDEEEINWTDMAPIAVPNAAAGV